MLLLLIVKYVGLYEVTEDNTKLDGLQRRTAYRYVAAGNVPFWKMFSVTLTFEHA